MAGAGAAVGNYHNIVSQSLSLLSLFLSLSLSLSSSCCSQSDKTENVVGPATPIFNVRDLTRKDDEGEEGAGFISVSGYWYWNWLCATA